MKTGNYAHPVSARIIATASMASGLLCMSPVIAGDGEVPGGSRIT